MRIYLSGKITGRDKADYTSQFARAEQFYKSGGFDKEINRNIEAKWRLELLLKQAERIKKQCEAKK